MTTDRGYRTQLLTNLLRGNPQVAVEEEKADGKVSKEIEYMFYAHLTDPTVLRQAERVEIQEQWGLWYDMTEANAASGSVRIRKTIPKAVSKENGGLLDVAEASTLVQTVKIKTADGNALEIPTPASEDALKAFKLLADSGMIKHRYIFPIEGTTLKWEVDMFLKPGSDISGQIYMDWCKIDLEVPNKETPLPHLPAGFTEAFNPKDEHLTPGQRQIAQDMQHFLSLPNTYVERRYVGI